MNQAKTKRWTTRSLCHSRERIVYEIAYTTVKAIFILQRKKVKFREVI